MSASCCRSLATRSITPLPNWVLSERCVLYPGILNLHFGNSLVSLIAAMSMEFAWRKISSSAFLLKIEFAFLANIRKLWFTVKGKGNLSLYQ